MADDSDMDEQMLGQEAEGTYEYKKRKLAARRTLLERRCAQQLQELAQVNIDYYSLLNAAGKDENETKIMTTGSKEHRVQAAAMAVAMYDLIGQGYCRDPKFESTILKSSKAYAKSSKALVAKLESGDVSDEEDEGMEDDDDDSDDEDDEADGDVLSDPKVKARLEKVQLRNKRLRRRVLYFRRQANNLKKRCLTADRYSIETELKKTYADFQAHSVLLGKDLSTIAPEYYKAHYVKPEQGPKPGRKNNATAEGGMLDNHNATSTENGVNTLALVASSEKEKSDKEREDEREMEKEHVFRAIIASVCHVIDHQFGPIPKLRADSNWQNSRRQRRIRTLAAPLSIAVRLIAEVAEEVADRKVAEPKTAATVTSATTTGSDAAATAAQQNHTSSSNNSAQHAADNASGGERSNALVAAAMAAAAVKPTATASTFITATTSSSGVNAAALPIPSLPVFGATVVTDAPATTSTKKTKGKRKLAAVTETVPAVETATVADNAASTATAVAAAAAAVANTSSATSTAGTAIEEVAAATTTAKKTKKRKLNKAESASAEEAASAANATASSTTTTANPASIAVQGSTGNANSSSQNNSNAANSHTAGNLSFWNIWT